MENIRCEENLCVLGMNNFEVALVKEICPACCKEMDGPIIMNSLLTEKCANEVKELHGKVVGFSDKFCEECQKYADDGIILIGIDESKSDNMKNPYRTGHFYVVKETWLDNINIEKIKSQAMKKRMLYVSHLIFEKQ